MNGSEKLMQTPHQTSRIPERNGIRRSAAHDNQQELVGKGVCAVALLNGPAGEGDRVAGIAVEGGGRRGKANGHCLLDVQSPILGAADIGALGSPDNIPISH